MSNRSNESGPASSKRYWANPPKIMFFDFNSGRHTFSKAESDAWRTDGGDVRKYKLGDGDPIHMRFVVPANVTVSGWIEIFAPTKEEATKHAEKKHEEGVEIDELEDQSFSSEVIVDEMSEGDAEASGEAPALEEALVSFCKQNGVNPEEFRAEILKIQGRILSKKT